MLKKNTFIVPSDSFFPEWEGNSFGLHYLHHRIVYAYDNKYYLFFNIFNT